MPYILIPVLIIGGLAGWRYFAARQSLTTPLAGEQVQAPIEVPKTLPGATLEDRVKSLEEVLTKLASQVNSLKSAGSTPTSGSLDARLQNVESAMVELKARVSSLEKANPAPATAPSGQAAVYIPLGSGGQISDQNWVTIPTFQVSLNPAQYPGYKNMQLEVNMRLNQPGGQLYVRLYNSSLSYAISSEISTDSTASTLVTSTGFMLPAGSESYVLQAKSSAGTPAFVDNARIKVNF